MTTDAAHNPRRGVPVESATVVAEEDRAISAITDREIDRSRRARRERDGHGLAAFADDAQGAVAALEAESFDVGADRFRHP